MKGNKVYNKIRISEIIFTLIGSTFVISLCMSFIIWFIYTSYSSDVDIRFMILPFLMLGFLIGYYGFYPIYLCWSYYQKDKNLTVIIDYEKSEIQYIEKEKEIQYIKVEDIVIIEHHSRYRISSRYDEIIIKNGKSFIITSLHASYLICDIKKAFPDIHSKIEHELSGKMFLPDPYNC